MDFSTKTQVAQSLLSNFPLQRTSLNCHPLPISRFQPLFFSHQLQIPWLWKGWRLSRRSEGVAQRSERGLSRQTNASKTNSSWSVVLQPHKPVVSPPSRKIAFCDDGGPRSPSGNTCPSYIDTWCSHKSGCYSVDDSHSSCDDLLDDSVTLNTRSNSHTSSDKTRSLDSWNDWPPWTVLNCRVILRQNAKTTSSGNYGNYFCLNPLLPFSLVSF